MNVYLCANSRDAGFGRDGCGRGAAVLFRGAGVTRVASSCARRSFICWSGDGSFDGGGFGSVGGGGGGGGGGGSGALAGSFRLRSDNGGVGSGVKCGFEWE